MARFATFGSLVEAPESLAAGDGPFGLITPQAAIWLDQALHPAKPIYNTGQTLTICTALDPHLFAGAVSHVIAESDALRLRFSQSGTSVAQYVVREVDHDLEFLDFSAERDAERAAAAWIERAFWKPLLPTDFPLFHFALAKISERHFIWLQKYHHLIIDATGRQLVAARVARIYNALAAGNAPLLTGGPQYRQAKEAENEYLASERYNADAIYWRARFAEVGKRLVNADISRSDKSRSGRPVRLDCGFTPDDSATLRSLARSQSSTVFKIIIALAWSCFSRLYKNSDLVFGVALANRPGPEFKNMVGLFSKVMPFRPPLEGAMSLQKALSVIDAALANDLEHQRFPTQHVMRGLELRHPGRNTLFDVAINYVRSDYGFDFGGKPVSCSNLSAGFALPWSIMALEYGRDAPIRIVIDYDSGLIQSGEAMTVLRCFRTLLAHASDRPDLALAQLDMGANEGFPKLAPELSEQASVVISRETEDASPPEDHIERTLQEIWRICFDGREIAANDNFFELGGDSLKAVSLIGECNRRHGTELAPTVLFEHPTIRALANAIRAASRAELASSVVKLRSGGDSAPLLLVHPIGGTVFCYRDLVSCLSDDRAIYGLQPPTPWARENIPASIEEIAEMYLRDAAHTLRPGPWHLAGWSFGGLVAFEIGRQLEVMGHPAASLTIIDTIAPGRGCPDEDDRTLLAAVAAALGLDLKESTALSTAAIASAVALSPETAHISEEQVERMLERTRNFRKLRHAYRPGRSRSALTLIRASADVGVRDADFDWTNLTEQPVAVVAVPATHQAIVFPPHVDRLARLLSEVMAGGTFAEKQCR